MSSKDDQQSGAPATGARAAGRAAPIGESCPASHPIKGNRNREGELIFRSPNETFYDRTKPEICFATEDHARAAGFRPPRGAEPWSRPVPVAEAPAEAPATSTRAVGLMSPVSESVGAADPLPVADRFARLLRFSLPQGYIGLAEELTNRIAPIMRRQPGFRSLTLLSDETSGEYVLLTHWETLDQVSAFDRSADGWRVRDIMSEHLTTVPQIEDYQVHNVPQRKGVATA